MRALVARVTLRGNTMVYYTWEQDDHCGGLHGMLTSREQALEYMGLPPDAKEIPPGPGISGECYKCQSRWRGEVVMRLRVVVA